MSFRPLDRRISAVRSLLGALTIALLLSCGGGGGDSASEDIGVFTGVLPTFDFNWEHPGGGDGGVGAGGDGDGGVGVGGDLGQFRKALVVVTFPNGSPVGNGSALTDEVNGMVTVKPGRGYDGPLYIELRGTAEASYYEEGKDAFVPFPAGQVIRGWIPRVNKNIGLTPFSDAAVQLLTEGSTPERVTGVPTGAQISAANNVVLNVLNQQFPKALEVDDITRLPFIKSPTIGAGSISIDARGRYGLVNGAFSKQAALFNASEPQPTLAAIRQLGADLRDGKLDGMNGAQPAVAADQRTYDPHSIAGELSSALAHQSFTFGDAQAKGVLPKVLNYGNTRYEGYLFDASLTPEGKAFDTVAGWVADNSRGRTLGQPFEKLPLVERTFGVYANMGHGSVFFKTNATKDKPSQLFAVGDNVNGELGANNDPGSPGGAVELTTLPSGLLPTHIAGGFAHTVARMNNGAVYTWGDNSWGQLGQGLDGAALARSQAPLLVNLPVGALAVAATSTASYALLADGRVYSWGSSLGFGLLGDGIKDSTRTSPLQIAALSDVVQIAARDNDAMALKRDGTILTWGSHPADPSGGFVPSDVTLPYNGGTPLPTAVSGIPAGTQIRKILTEQGLFNALAADGTVYGWGVHFDRTAGEILYDLTPTPVLGLPRVRDLMPGGFFGYGDRSFDRLTALGIDYRSNMWKVRGRVAEQFDPADPAQQRRPRGQAPRRDCASCHLLLTDWPLTAPPPTSNTVCVPPTSIHGDPATGTSLIHTDTPCEQCHNPARTTPAPSFTNGWLNCLRPTNLPVRENPSEPPIVSNSCAVPTGHVFTPPGTVCSTCHNSIIARPLGTLPTACAQPKSNELPSISTTARIVSAVNDQNVAIASGSSTRDTTPTLQGTLSTALAANQSVRVRRDGAALPGAATLGTVTSWSFTDPGASNGSHTYDARVEAGSAFGPTNNSYVIVVDTVIPGSAANVTAISDDFSGVLQDGATTTDSTPTISGTLTGGLGAGESVQLLRSIVGAPAGTPAFVIGNVPVSGTTFAFTEPTALSSATYSYQARIIDAAGNQTGPGSSRSVTISTSFSAPTIAAINGSALSANAAPPTRNRTFAVAGSFTGALPSGTAIRLYQRAGTTGTFTLLPGAATVVPATSTNWTYSVTGSLADQVHFFFARVETVSAPTAVGTDSNTASIVVDNGVPAQTITISATSSVTPFNNVVRATSDSALGSQTNDPSPRLVITLNAPLASGPTVAMERLSVTGRNGAITTTTTSCPSVPANTFCFLDDTTGVTIATPSTTPSVTPAGASVDYSVRVVDDAGNQQATAATRPRLSFDYFVCDQARAHFARSGGTSETSGHATISAGSPSAVASCSGSSCHSATSPATPAGGTTAAGTFVPVPASTPSYWCRRPA